MESIITENTTEAKTTNRQFITFQIGKETYGIEVMRAREVMYLVEITEVPNTLPFMKGVMDLRGVIVPLIDARAKFNLKVRDYDIDTVTIILEYPEQTLGLIVDSVSDVVGLSKSDIQDPSRFPEASDKNYVDGIAKVDEKLIILLNIDKIFTDKEMKGMLSKKQ
ncbi:chemotaxis protein CheW [Spirochaetota bacterium]